MSDEERAQVLLACKILHPEKSPVRMITDKTWGGFSGVNEDELIRTMFGSMISQTPKF